MRRKITAPIAGFSYDPEGIVVARKLRRRSTPAEQAAWDALRGRRMLGLKFRRQQPIRGFIVDFYCASERLAIELDGDVHLDPEQRRWDAERDAILSRCGIRVIRVKNEDASADHLERLLRTALEKAPLPQGEGLG